MVRPARLTSSRALLTTLLGALGAALLCFPPAGLDTAAAAPATATTPLRIELDEIAPSVVPRRGTLTVEGSIANVSDQTWRNIKLYTFLGDTPIDDVAELAAATAVDEDSLVGERIVDPGTEATVETLPPGESASFTLRVPSRLLLDQISGVGEPRPGVYWFGVHALGADDDGRDDFTDARARTFLPLQPRGATPVDTAIVVPLRARIRHAPDGSLRNPTGWGQLFSLGGRLRDRVEFGAASGADPVSWLIDPALLQAASTLASGNQPRTLAPSPGRSGDDSSSPSPSPSDPSSNPPSSPPSGPDDPSGSTSPTDEPDPDTSGTGDVSSGAAAGPAASDPAGDASATPSASPEVTEDPGTVLPPETDPAIVDVAERALAWLGRLTSEVGSDELLALPYGDVDVAAALTHDPATYESARAQPSPVLRRLSATAGTTTAPVVAPPTGYLDPDVIAALGGGEVLLGSDRMIDGSAPGVAVVEGQPVVLASSGAAAGGPGPGPALSSLALRQRILSEATLRSLAVQDASPDPQSASAREPGPEPLVVVMPPGWDAQSGSSFFAGLRTPGVRLTTLSQAAPGAVASPDQTDAPGSGSDGAPVAVEASAVRYPARQAGLALGAAPFAADDALGVAARTLQGILPLNTEVAATVDGEALSSLSYSSRKRPSSAVRDLTGARRSIEGLLGSVTISAPDGVTLSGASGTFSATVSSSLDQPVVVRVASRTDAGLTVPVSAPIELAPGARATVPLQANDVSPGVHDVLLRLVDPAGDPLPATDLVPIRSAQVSNVIWLIMGTGVGLLLLTIAARGVRRLRARGAER